MRHLAVAVACGICARIAVPGVCRNPCLLVWALLLVIMNVTVTVTVTIVERLRD